MKIPPAPKIPLFDNGHWSFDMKMGNGIGFIYVIRDKELKKLYLGKKQYRSTRGEQKEYNWKGYVSSSATLQKMFEFRDKEEFDFICLDEYKTKGGLKYAETWSLCFVNAVMKEEWLNGQIEKITWKVKEGVTRKHIERLGKTILWENIR